MKTFVRIAMMLALLSTPLFAARFPTVNIPEKVTVGTTAISAGHYQVSYEVLGKDAKVTLTKSGASPILLNARLMPGKNGPIAVTCDTARGIRVLIEIDLPKATFAFEKSQMAHE